jgi:hypothetical protein
MKLNDWLTRVSSTRHWNSILSQGVNELMKF